MCCGRRREASWLWRDSHLGGIVGACHLKQAMSTKLFLAYKIYSSKTISLHTCNILYSIGHSPSILAPINVLSFGLVYYSPSPSLAIFWFGRNMQYRPIFDHHFWLGRNKDATIGGRCASLALPLVALFYWDWFLMWCVVGLCLVVLSRYLWPTAPALWWFVGWSLPFGLWALLIVTQLV